jgi:hypothetical protein
MIQNRRNEALYEYSDALSADRQVCIGGFRRLHFPDDDGRAMTSSLRPMGLKRTFIFWIKDLSDAISALK